MGKSLGLTVYRLQISLWSNNLTNVIYFIISFILNDTVHISGPFCVIFKTFCLNVINNFFLTEFFFLRFSNKLYFAPQKLMHTPASRQPGASYAQRSPWHTKKGFRYARLSGDETLHGHLWPTYFRHIIINPLTAKLLNLNFHPLEVVSRWRDPQLQVSENYSDLTKWRSTLFKSCCLMSHFIFNIFK